ncbi:hypothetical protein [Planomonospora sp. ID82291]|uniref:hypothetical protein n=1 Tax=Planomonospora sp. ID82291 TaxID=2738136 RepID=UPI0018C3B272|nr:hypothetical protein [Planomonospora sp. ID82291]MBG0818337.1 hypothetical protein [Planomonospora sp. ID82291]
MAFQERTDPSYWASAYAFVSEGFCPDCGQPLSVRAQEIRRDGRTEQAEIPECVPCQAEWQPRRLLGVGEGWIRFQRTEDVLRRFHDGK